MSLQPINGACLCEGIQFKVTGSPEKVFACYCIDCSKGAGGLYQLMAKFPKESINLCQGQDLCKTWIVTETTSGKDKHKVFCGQCGCTLWTIPMNHGGEKIIVRTSLFGEQFYSCQPTAEFFAKLRPPFLAPIIGGKSFDNMPGA
ncbi:hypothetical protein ONS95_014437 [Cadophora gregata]|uniref:uncharacterized protein n=1 Tax=Cadophora gregata TaxID=51156 RepID=UPI0026DCD7DA|nr:uncharacterized protein ONS95_014437 [Cadophora gregata]KAK0112699.1 hypothetical protein ONS95_014437 [Cadophora gregata]KAK0124832.1 hypothetical protein ONS96_008713 [Cadophora gregata f. sp. sojae]